uniref:Very-long-chain (3R)-3-hydroxyacyl-CoA dehydratase n=1 Tax=Salix viminalis TaxID=40686 RepID=A0A6N2KLC9_SALVM
MPAFSKLYLFAYNSLQAFGWAVSLLAILINFFSTHSLDGAYASAGDLICLLQTVSFLEVIHGALGIVPSGVLFPFMQWGGRTHFVLAIVRQIVEVQELPSVFITFVAWSIAEVIRYSHYALNCIGSCPSLITYLRYTVFIVLYPIGLAPGEMWTMYQALPFVKKKNLCADLFAAFPFSYYNFLRISFPKRKLYQGLQFSVVILLVSFSIGHLNNHTLALYGSPFLDGGLTIMAKHYWQKCGMDLCGGSLLENAAVLVCYPFLWLNLYRHLLKQRRSKLGRHQETKKKK